MPEGQVLQVHPTPNPLAWKFILSVPVLTEGKATFTTPDEASRVRLASDLMALMDVTQVHFFSNVITVSLTPDADPSRVHPDVVATIETRLPVHDPDGVWTPEAPKKERWRPDDESLAEQVELIEVILDERVRPGLQGDGGDLEVLGYEENVLYVRYEGACGGCPSATQGTLYAIEGILQDEFDPNISVMAV